MQSFREAISDHLITERQRLDLSIDKAPEMHAQLRGFLLYFDLLSSCLASVLSAPLQQAAARRRSDADPFKLAEKLREGLLRAGWIINRNVLGKPDEREAHCHPVIIVGID